MDPFLQDLRTGADSGGAGPPFCLHFGDLWCTFGHLGSSLGSPGAILTLIWSGGKKPSFGVGPFKKVKKSGSQKLGAVAWGLVCGAKVKRHIVRRA